MTNNLLQMLPQLKANPAQFLQRMGFNIPQNLNNPNDIIQYLMSSGRVSQAQYNQARQMVSQFRPR